MQTIFSKKGNALILSVVIGAAISFSLAGALQLALSTHKRDSAKRLKRNKEVLVNLIVDHAMNELRDKFEENVGPDAGNCTLDFLLTDDSLIFREDAPRVYGKGIFSHDLSKNKNKSQLIISEMDPEVWIEKAQTDNWYRLYVKAKICDQRSRKVTLFTGSDPDLGLGIDWSPACPKLESVHSRRIFNATSSGFASPAAQRGCDFPDAPEIPDNLPPPIIGGPPRFPASAKPEGEILVLHSQSPFFPTCPKGYAKLWQGYSYMGGWIDDGYGAPQDLSSTGSCSEQIHPLPFIQCKTYRCNYDSANDRSLWLSIIRFHEVKSTRVDIYESNRNEAIANISRCAVCEGANKLLVQHSLSNEVIPCPDGWTQLWEGYSLAIGQADGSAYDSGQDLGGTGSCLRHFVPAPTNYCTYYTCYGGSGFAMWLFNKNKKSDTHYRKHNNATKLAYSQSRISRCNVCVKPKTVEKIDD